MAHEFQRAQNGDPRTVTYPYKNIVGEGSPGSVEMKISASDGGHMIVKTNPLGRTIYENSKRLKGDYSVKDVYYDGLGRVGKVSLPYKGTSQATNHIVFFNCDYKHG